VSFDIKKEIKRTPDDKVFIGMNDNRKPILLDWSEMTEHTHAMGGSGSGKTSLFVIPKRR